MAIKSGRVGVAQEQVDVYGRLIPTEWLIDRLREILDTNQAEINALRLAREELARIELERPVITPIVEPPIEEESLETGVEEVSDELDEPIINTTKTRRKSE